MPPSKILVGFDGSDESRDALALAKTLAEEIEADVVVALAFPELRGGSDAGAMDPRLMDAAEPILDEARAYLSFLPKRLAVAERVLGGLPAVEALELLATAENARLIVIGSCHRSAIGRVAAGSVGERLLRAAPAPLAIAPRGFASRERPSIRSVGLAFDGGEESRRALPLAESLARRASAILRLVGVLEATSGSAASLAPEPTIDHDTIREPSELELELNAMLAELPAELAAQKILLRGDYAAEELIETGERLFDLLVVGAHARGPLGRMLHGSVSTELVRHAPWPLVIVSPSATIDIGTAVGGDLEALEAPAAGNAE